MGTSRHTCAECVSMREICCDYGICEDEFLTAYRKDGCSSLFPIAVGYWTLNFVANNIHDMQEVACEHFTK